MCAFCHSTLENQLEARNMDEIEVLGLTEMIGEYLDDED